jgi:hypothetical protein
MFTKNQLIKTYDKADHKAETNTTCTQDLMDRDAESVFSINSMQTSSTIVKMRQLESKL